VCLVINKIDRLIVELCLSPDEAYHRLRAIVMEVNGILSLFQSER
jgi:ribosome assembly protein 1